MHILMGTAYSLYRVDQFYQLCNQATTNVNTANPSKLIEKNVLDLRNMFSNHENIRMFPQNTKNKLTEKNFLVPSTRKFDLK